MEIHPVDLRLCQKHRLLEVWSQLHQRMSHPRLADPELFCQNLRIPRTKRLDATREHMGFRQAQGQTGRSTHRFLSLHWLLKSHLEPRRTRMKGSRGEVLGDAHEGEPSEIESA